MAKPTLISSLELFGSAKEICIKHDDLIYRLRITKQGKLILNK
ncbi:MAG: hemin uptake protein HemP [Pseudomonadota bacterium]